MPARPSSRPSPTGWRRTRTPTTPPATAPPTRRSAWVERDPLARLEAYLLNRGMLDQARPMTTSRRRQSVSPRVCATALSRDVEPDAASLFAHVYSRPTALLEAEAAWLAEQMRFAPARSRRDRLDGGSAQPGAPRRHGGGRLRPRLRGGRRPSRRRLPRDRRVDGRVRGEAAASTRRSPRAASWARPSAWRCTASGRWWRCSSTPSRTRPSNRSRAMSPSCETAPAPASPCLS